mgnify:CR=1 FL=1
MNILAIDASTSLLSVALQYGDEVNEQQTEKPRGQAQDVLGLIDSLLAKCQLGLADIDLLAYSAGPASFTGVRLAASVLQAIGMVHDTPIAEVSSLQALAQAAWRQQQYQQVVVCNNAHMGELYWAEFSIKNATPVLQGQEQLVKPDALPNVGLADWVAIGDGWQRYPESTGELLAQTRHYNAEIRASATDIIKLAVQQQQTSKAVDLDPQYLRQADAWKTLSEQ